MKCLCLRGFTLFELLMVLSLVAVTAILAIPSFQNLITKNRLETTSLLLVTAINYTRISAIQKHSLVALCPSRDGKFCETDWSRGMIVFTDPNGDFTPSPERLLRYFAINSNQMHVQWNRNTNIIEMMPSGFLKSQNGSFVVSLNNETNFSSITVILSRTGRVRLESH